MKSVGVGSLGAYCNAGKQTVMKQPNSKILGCFITVFSVGNLFSGSCLNGYPMRT